jgi:hypothetical protein
MVLIRLRDHELDRRGTIVRPPKKVEKSLVDNRIAIGVLCAKLLQGLLTLKGEEGEVNCESFGRDDRHHLKMRMLSAHGPSAGKAHRDCAIVAGNNENASYPDADLEPTSMPGVGGLRVSPTSIQRPCWSDLVAPEMDIVIVAIMSGFDLRLWHCSALVSRNPSTYRAKKS